MRLELGRVIVRSQPKILAGQVRVHHLVRVHRIAGIPDRLELAEGANQLGTEHLGQERRLGLAVAVLARDRTAIRDDQVSSLVQELAEVLDPFDRLQIEVDPGVDATLAEVAVKRAAVVVLREQLAQVAQVVPHPIGWDGRIFPALPRIFFAGNARRGTQAGFADFPEVFFLGLVVEQLHGRRVARPT